MRIDAQTARIRYGDRVMAIPQLDPKAIALALVVARETAPALVRQAMNETASVGHAAAMLERFAVLFEASRGQPFAVPSDATMVALPRAVVAELASRARRGGVSVAEVIERLLR